MKKIKQNYTCSLELTMDLVGGKWKLFLLWQLASGVKRFSTLKNATPGITQKMLTQQLRELEEVGIIAREVYPVIPPKVEYSLTESGVLLIPVLKQLCSWSSEYATKNNIVIN